MAAPVELDGLDGLDGLVEPDGLDGASVVDVALRVGTAVAGEEPAGPVGTADAPGAVGVDPPEHAPRAARAATARAVTRGRGDGVQWWVTRRP
ncbi:hypothetical protein DFJ68_1811 [Terracoccus luteus]|uniref:Uncharacterized protein n=1 Tax=Terracoccus luteus TaxID=53356 RepID=A0A495XVS8_9MICO|nr:hypothetical protein DFJ68_1811 [Terracoccus luteus]